MDSVFGCQSLLWLKYHRSPAFVKEFLWEIFSFNERYNVFNTSAEEGRIYTNFSHAKKSGPVGFDGCFLDGTVFYQFRCEYTGKKDVAPE